MQKRRGFTLIELLIALAIITLLVAIFVPVVEQARKLTKQVIRDHNREQQALASLVYASD